MHTEVDPRDHQSIEKCFRSYIEKVFKYQNIDLEVFESMKKLQANHPLDWQLIDLFFYLDFSKMDINGIESQPDAENELNAQNCIKFARLNKFDSQLFNKACCILAAY